MNIPFLISDNERIVRVLLYPKHFIDEKSLKWQAFRTRADEDEVSVIRLDYCDENFCKNHGKLIENKENKASYFGLGVLKASEIRGVDADVVYTPIHHIYQADIKINFIPSKGEAPPAEIKYKMEEMASMARIYKDTDPSNSLWIDGPIS